MSVRALNSYGFLVFADPHYLGLVILRAIVSISDSQLQFPHPQADTMKLISNEKKNGFLVKK